MANWSNVRLIAVGHERDLARLRRLARPYLAEARKPPAWTRRPRGAPFDPPDPLFSSDMIHGEGGDLFEGPVTRLPGDLVLVVYHFQSRNDDGVEHFCGVSTRFPTVRFLVVWGDPNGDSFGSAYVRKGKATLYELGDRRRTAIYSRWRREYGASPDDDDEAYAWDAFSEMMDVAERRWDACLHPRTSRGPRGRRSTRPARRQP
jgi:hypothetical protein